MSKNITNVDKNMSKKCLLQEVDKYVRTNCRLPTRTMIENMIRVHEAIRKVNLRISPETVNNVAKVPDGNGKGNEIFK